MAKVYKIHPAIGIARIGNATGFFIGPEKPGHPGVEITVTGEARIAQYKAGGKVKKQAARFRIWEYDEAPGGALTALREITSEEAAITWRVHLVNSKAAGKQIQPQAQPGGYAVLAPIGPPRNSPITDRASLIIDGGMQSIASGTTGSPTFKGFFLGKSVALGQLRTDAKGRLLVLGGDGESEGIPSSPGGAVQALSSYANNNRWHDDVSDGPVSAEIKFGSGPIITVQDSAWVICAPPDFAPQVSSFVTLYDVALEAAVEAGLAAVPTTVSFRRDVQPILARAASMRWTSLFSHWAGVSEDWPALSPTSLAARPLRDATAQKILGSPLSEVRIPSHIRRVLTEWVEGRHINDWGMPEPTLSEPEALDRAALESGVGANFYPGIEGSFLLSQKALYRAPFRFLFTTVAGQITEAMALPWQADFHDCAGTWWPSQRPDSVFRSAADVPDNPKDWSRGAAFSSTAASRKLMKEKVLLLGFVTPVTVAGSTVLLESERDDTLGA